MDAWLYGVLMPLIVAALLQMFSVASLLCVGFVAFVFDVVHGCKIQLFAMISCCEFLDYMCVFWKVHVVVLIVVCVVHVVVA